MPHLVGGGGVTYYTQKLGSQVKSTKKHEMYMANAGTVKGPNATYIPLARVGSVGGSRWVGEGLR